jgi:hypothetical protein
VRAPRTQGVSAGRITLTSVRKYRFNTDVGLSNTIASSSTFILTTNARLTMITSRNRNKPAILRPLCRLLVLASVFAAVRSGACQDKDASQDPIPAAAAADTNATQKARAAMLMEGVWNSIEKIHAIDVRIVEVITSPDKTEQVEYLYAFDKERDLVRYDRHAADRLIQYAKNDSEVLWHSMRDGRVRGITRYARDYKITVDDASPYGFLTAPLLPGGAYLVKLTEEDLRKITNQMVHSQLAEFNETERNIELTFEYDMQQDPTQRGRSLMVLDREQGTMPTLVEQSLGPRDASPLTVNARTETVWKQVGDVWVPTSCRMANLELGQSWDLTYDWKHVNEPLPKELFTANGFAAPIGTLVMNNKLGGAPVLEEIVGEEPKLKDGPPSSPSSRIRIWIIAINVVAIALAGILWLVRSRTRR